MHDSDNLEIVYTCPACETETVLEPGLTQCSGCGALMPVIMLPDFKSNPYDDDDEDLC
jgi:hypothetical protein